VSEHNDPPLPPGAKAYLAAFDRYLMASRTGISSEAREARSEMRDHLDVMLDGTSVSTSNRTHHIGLFKSEAGLRGAYVRGEIEADEFEARLAVVLNRVAA
jgi:hypothetical protein